MMHGLAPLLLCNPLLPPPLHGERERKRGMKRKEERAAEQLCDLISKSCPDSGDEKSAEIPSKPH